MRNISLKSYMKAKKVVSDYEIWQLLEKELRYVQHIKIICSAYYAMSVEELNKQTGRYSKYKDARQMTWLILREHYGVRWGTIAEAFGYKQHDTIIRGVRRVKWHKQTESKLRSEYYDLLELLKIKAATQ